MVETIKIYALRDAGGIRYVGKTVQRLQDRLIAHKSNALDHRHTLKQKWLAELYNNGSKPEIILLEVVPSESGNDAERKWFDRLRKMGCDLVNDSNRVGVGASSHRRKINWKLYGHLLGKIPDEDLAKKIGVTRKAVAYQRHKRNISPCGMREERRVLPPPMGGHNRIELPSDIISKLGTMADNKLAQLADVSKKRIMVARHRRNIPSWAEQNNHPTRFNGVGLHPCWGVPMKGG